MGEGGLDSAERRNKLWPRRTPGGGGLARFLLAFPAAALVLSFSSVTTLFPSPHFPFIFSIHSGSYFFFSGSSVRCDRTRVRLLQHGKEKAVGWLPIWRFFPSKFDGYIRLG